MGRITVLLIVVFFLSISCTENGHLFKIHQSDKTGITFNNVIQDSETFNILNYEYLYNGGGVGIGDFNKDGKYDLFFAGNMVPNQLYLNQGDLKFKNVSSEAGIEAADKWSTGVAVVDINEDGWDDIYVCGAFFYQDEKLRNMMFINKGLNEDGVPLFQDEALEYGIADEGYSTHAAFFDYDLDGDQDLYVLTNRLEIISPNKFKVVRVNGEAPTTDRLYRNNGDGSFTNVSREAGILVEGYGLGINVSDFNLDGWPDVYVSNDYLSNDLLWINQKDGTFKNEIAKIFKHQSHSAMGNDVADLNDDGLPDIFTLEMLPVDHERRKRMQVGNQYSKYVNTEKLEYQYQYTRNTLQIHQGIDENGLPKFSDLGMMADVHASDWSWATLIQDFDHDLDKDLFVSNGFPKDVTDMDYMAFRQELQTVSNKKAIYEQIPEANIPNVYFQNDGALSFKEVSQEIGMDVDSYSNGSAFADLDGDGDLDLVTNNINQGAFIYENLVSNKADSISHYLRISLYDSPSNPYGSGAKIKLNISPQKSLYYDHFLYRGYMSSMDPVAHFGLGRYTSVQTIEITWADGSTQVIQDVKADQVLKVVKNNDVTTAEADEPPKQSLFSDARGRTKIQFHHFDAPFLDFNIQRTLPFQLSQQGPSLSVGDVNGDGLEDFFAGGSLYDNGTLFVQNVSGSFTSVQLPLDDPKPYEDMGCLLFDMDGDHDLDLYIVSGSYENALGKENYEDRVYENDGSGNYRRVFDAVISTPMSGSAVKGSDYDGDGDIDLFVGGRLLPGGYPMPVSSQILRNDSRTGLIRLTDVTSEVAPGLIDYGLVTDALWTDFDGDDDRDLLLLSEWGEPTIFQNEGGVFASKKLHFSTEMAGLWKSIAAGDFDSDGDMDYVLGNFGLNTEFKASEERPIRIFASDYDKNGSVDPIIACYFPSEKGGYESFPMHSKDDLTKQLTILSKRFLKYSEYAQLSVEEILTEEELKESTVLEVTQMSTLILENRTSNGDSTNQFITHLLPAQAQVAPVYGIQTGDFDSDGFLDILLVGNDFGVELFSGRHDALYGLFLKGNGAFEFTPQNFTETGFNVPGDAKALAKLSTGNQVYLLASQNQDSLLVHSLDAPQQLFRPDSEASYCSLIHSDGRVTRHELYWGDTFLTQSTRDILVPAGVIRIESFDNLGNKIEEEAIQQ